MAEELIIPEGATRKEIYKSLYPQLVALTNGEKDQIANMANIVASIKESINFLWVGFYRVVGDKLVLGPFQGPVACTNIAFGKGVCGSAWKDEKTVIVPNVEEFPGHIACSAHSRSEIVVPVIKNNKVIAVLDIDSDELNSFSKDDAIWLQNICSLL